ncbi:MAG TPA: M67 family metallopeptidase [Acidimicrobiia bacterium]
MGSASGGAGRVLRLTESQHAVILGNCYDGLPNEACGLLLGPMLEGRPTGAVSEARPCVNADASARTYTVAPKDMLRAMRAADERGEEIVGVWHSHTHTDPYPSPTDVRQAADPAWIYVIVSLRHGDPSLRAYSIVDATITELPVTLLRG